MSSLQQALLRRSHSVFHRDGQSLPSAGKMLEAQRGQQDPKVRQCAWWSALLPSPNCVFFLFCRVTCLPETEWGRDYSQCALWTDVVILESLQWSFLSTCQPDILTPHLVFRSSRFVTYSWVPAGVASSKSQRPCCSCSNMSSSLLN